MIKKCIKCGNDLNGSYKELCRKCYHELWYIKNGNIYKKKQKIWRQQNKEIIKKRDKEYYQKNKKETLRKNKIWKINNKEKCDESNNRWRKNNPEKERISGKKYYLKNKDKVDKQRKIYEKNKLQNDLDYKLRVYLSNRTYTMLKKNKSCGTIKLIGCTIQKYRKHQEKQWQEGMNWDNYGEWEIDHIIPLSFYDLSKLEQQKMAFNYLNTQPLWKKDNLKKSNKIELK